MRAGPKGAGARCWCDPAIGDRGRRDEQSEEDEDEERPPGGPRRSGSGDDAHGKPPFEGRSRQAAGRWRRSAGACRRRSRAPAPRRARSGARAAAARRDRRRSCELPSGDSARVRRVRRYAIVSAHRRERSVQPGLRGPERDARAPPPRRAAASRGSSAGRRPRAARVEPLSAASSRSRSATRQRHVADDRCVDRRRARPRWRAAAGDATMSMQAWTIEPVEPGVEPIGIAQPGQVPPGAG